MTLSRKGRKGHLGGYASLFGAAFLLAFILGGQSWSEITDPQLVTGLPEWTRRWTIAASYAIIAPAALTCFVTARQFRDTPTETYADGAAEHQPAY